MGKSKPGHIDTYRYKKIKLSMEYRDLEETYRSFSPLERRYNSIYIDRSFIPNKELVKLILHKIRNKINIHPFEKPKVVTKPHFALKELIAGLPCGKPGSSKKCVVRNHVNEISVASVKKNNPIIDFEKDLLNLKEAASYIGVSRSTLGRWKKRGVGPTTVGHKGMERYKRKEIDIFLKSYTPVPYGSHTFIKN